MGGGCSQNSSGGSRCQAGGSHSGAGTAERMALTNLDTGENPVAAKVPPAFCPSSPCQRRTVGEPPSGRESGKCNFYNAEQSPEAWRKDLRENAFLIYLDLTLKGGQDLELA